MSVIDLGAVAFPKLDPKLVVVLLADGPCAGTHVHVPGTGVECWQRVGKPRRPGVETQMWALYHPHPFRRWEYAYSGVTITSDEMTEALSRHKAAGHTHGESYGA